MEKFNIEKENFKLLNSHYNKVENIVENLSNKLLLNEIKLFYNNNNEEINLNQINDYIRNKEYDFKKKEKFYLEKINNLEIQQNNKINIIQKKNISTQNEQNNLIHIDKFNELNNNYNNLEIKFNKIKEKNFKF